MIALDVSLSMDIDDFIDRGERVKRMMSPRRRR